MLATSAPPVAPNDLSGGPRMPLPPVSEHGTLKTEPRMSGTHSRPPPVQNVPQFAFSNIPHPHNLQSFVPTTTSTASTTPPLPNATKIDMERIMKQDEAAMNDFVPPRQAMNSDE